MIVDYPHPAPARDATQTLTKRRLGTWGEELVAAYITDLGWSVLDRNWRGRDGELDIVALDPSHTAGTTLVVVEVKTRSGSGFGPGSVAVTARKYARLRRLAAQWIEEHQARCSSVRIDVISVAPAHHAPGFLEGSDTLNGAIDIDHIEGAFR